jgi:3-oxoacyl-[acyl-carrier protein] reductase
MLLSESDVAFISGGAQGIGKAIALLFAQEGARVVVADLNEELALNVAAGIQAQTGRDCLGLRLDISSEAEVGAAIAACLAHFGSLSILVNNAGIYMNSPILEMTKESWERIFEVNVTGTFLMTKAAARVMIERKRGRIIDISSCSAKKADPGQAAYNASKSAIIGLMRVTALELGPYGITCNAVLPGATDTEMTRNSFLTSPEVERDWIDRTALKRLGRPEDMARVALFLASDLAGHVTGESIVVSAGELMTQ